jgi:hypothetical protein
MLIWGLLGGRILVEGLADGEKYMEWVGHDEVVYYVDDDDHDDYSANDLLDIVPLALVMGTCMDVLESVVGVDWVDIPFQSRYLHAPSPGDDLPYSPKVSYSVYDESASSLV